MMRVTNGILGVVLILSGVSLWAQPGPAEAKPSTDVSAVRPSYPVEMFYLTNVSQVSDGNEIVTALRNLLAPTAKIYFVANQSAIILQAAPDQVVLARKLINDLDRPKKTYRLTYTIAELDNGKKVGTQHFSMIVVTGQRTTLKQGSKVPIATGSYSEKGTGAGAQTQFTYLDIGMNFDATLDEFVNGVRLRTKVEQLSVAEEKSGVGLQDPVIRQTALEGTSFLSVGKPLKLGSVDIPGSTRHLDVEVVMELVP